MEEVGERDELTEAVIGAAIEAQRELGPGLLESVYQKCLDYEMRLRNLEFVPKRKLPILCKGNLVHDDELEMDFFFPGRLVVEIKAVENLIPVHEAQLLTYLRLSETRIGLLINVNVRLLMNGIKRMAL